MSNLMMCSRCRHSVMVHELQYGLCRTCIAGDEDDKKRQDEDRRRRDEEHQQMVNDAVMTACLATVMMS